MGIAGPPAREGERQKAHASGHVIGGTLFKTRQVAGHQTNQFAGACTSGRMIGANARLLSVLKPLAREGPAIIEGMVTVRITEAELVRDVGAVLEKVRQGSEVMVEREDHRPVVVISAPQRSGRPITGEFSASVRDIA
jgi:hypothetical protein